MLVFDKVSPENTPITINLALEKAKEISADIVLSTTTGASALQCVELASKADFKKNIIAVTHVWGFETSGKNELSDEVSAKLKEAGVKIVTAAHTLSGVERSFSNKFGGVYPVEIMAHTLRMFSQGVKVSVEIASMALDSGALRTPQPVISLGGTATGLDTACVITPGYSARIFETRVHEILCKPY